MNENVIVSIKGLRVVENTDEDVEVIVHGRYFLKNKKHYILYEEIDEETGASIMNTIKIYNDGIEVAKKGAINSKLSFESNKSFQSIYSTPYGEFIMETKSNDIELDITDALIKASVEYELYVNGDKLSNNNIVIRVKNVIHE